MLEAILASGGFGVVYRAGGARPAAVKVLHAELAAAPGALARFERELALPATLDHPGLCRVLQVGRVPDGRPYYAMELLDGVDLQGHLAARGRLDPAACLAILAPVCDALAAAHRHGVVHRDVKAANVFVCADGRVVLLDFGIAKLVDPAAASLTLSRQIVGTPSAMAPEQVSGHPVDARTDVYGLGALLYHLLVGRPPFFGDSATTVQQLHRYARRPRPSEEVELPAALDALVVRAMAIDPARRPDGAAALCAELRAALTPGLVTAPAASCRPAIQVEVRADIVDGADGAAGADAELALDDMEVVWAATRAALGGQGFVIVREASEAALFAATAELVDPAAVARALAATLAERPGPSPHVVVKVSVPPPPEVHP